MFNKNKPNHQKNSPFQSQAHARPEPTYAPSREPDFTPRPEPMREHSEQNKMPQPQPQKPQSSKNGQSQSFIYKLWNFSSIESIERTSGYWANNVQRGASANTAIAGLSILFCVFAALSILFDLLPSYMFASDFAQSSFFTSMTSSPYLSELRSVFTSQNIRALVFGLTLTPLIFEFVGTGLALAGSLVVAWGIKIFVVFDIFTDAPGAGMVGKWLAEYLLSSAPDFIQGLFSWVFSAFWLMCSTFFFETITISLFFAIFRLAKSQYKTY